MTEKSENGLTTILRRKQVEARTGLSCSTIYALIAEDKFPRQINLSGGRSVGWIESEIEAWLKSRINKSRDINNNE